ncbi:MAG: T9SS type A sorting domain-containing protein [Saprospiraceae bacterium]
MNRLNLLTLCLVFLLPFISFSQGWEKTYDGGFNEICGSASKTLDGGIIMAGKQSNLASETEYPLLYRTDIEGNLIWEFYDTLSVFISLANSLNVLSTSDSNFLFTYYYAPFNQDNFSLKKISPNGDLIWNANLDSSSLELVRQMKETSDNGFILIGANFTTNNTVIVKINASGNIVWEKEFFPVGEYLYIWDMTITANEDIIISGYNSTINSGVGLNVILKRLDANGNIIWEKEYNNGPVEYGFNVVELDNGDLVLAGTSSIDAFGPFIASLLKTDANGNQIWYKEYLNLGDQVLSGLQKTSDGGFVIAGSTPIFNTLSYRDYYLLKTDADGNEMWTQSYGRSKHDHLTELLLADDGGFYLSGYTQNVDDTRDIYLVKTDSLGFSLPNKINGHLYFDENEDCQLQPVEIGLNQWLVKAAQGNDEYFKLTDSTGYYEFRLDTGTYQITTYETTPYWEICNNNFDITFANVFDTIVENIGVQAIIDCPLLDISIGTPVLRRCFENTYTIQYCNYGTIDAADAYVEIEFDTAMTIIDSSIPIASQIGNIYTFDLGNIPWGDCNFFNVNVLLGDTTDCDAIPLGTTHCVEAHIYPDSICLPSGSWSGASVEVDANCSGDTISFFIQNVGTATTQTNLQYIVVEDDVILFEGNFTLDPMENEIILIPTNGSTFRLEAEQEPNHPGMSMPSVTVEGCTVNPTLTLGFLNIFSEDDGDTFIDIDCRENVGAYDPNDKMGFPLGYGSENYINRGQDIEYQIRFQNTGTDTAFNIVVVDTLSEFLDITTVRPGASSHPYQFDISTGGRLSFTFSNIMLPDSFVNEPTSNGFVRFKVSQKHNLDLGTQILNSAAIYFDFNAPILTNQTLHTIGENFVIVSIESPSEKSLGQVNTHPNPFTQFVNFEIEGLEIKNGNFKLFDAMGRLLREQKFSNNTFTFQKKDLQAGMYFFTIEENGQLISNGKLIAQ